MKIDKIYLNYVIASLETNPDQWKIDRWHATNRILKISIWIANDSWALRVEENGVTRIGDGITIAPPFIRYFTWRGKLWRAIEKAKNFHISSQGEAIAKLRADREKVYDAGLEIDKQMQFCRNNPAAMAAYDQYLTMLSLCGYFEYKSDK